MRPHPRRHHRRLLRRRSPTMPPCCASTRANGSNGDTRTDAFVMAYLASAAFRVATAAAVTKKTSDGSRIRSSRRRRIHGKRG